MLMVRSMLRGSTCNFLFVTQSYTEKSQRTTEGLF